jgi:predicted ATPase
VGAGVEKRVVFPKGKTTVNYRGKTPLHEGNYDAYYFPAKKMQTLTVKLACDDAEAYLAIYETKELGPDEDTILANDLRSREWTGRLPVNGEYSVQVYDASENGVNRAAYTVEISLR